jgi:hypothetical protein
VYAYFEDKTGRKSVSKLLSKDEVRRIAVNTPSCRVSCAARNAGAVLMSAFGGKADIDWMSSDVCF